MCIDFLRVRVLPARWAVMCEVKNVGKERFLCVVYKALGSPLCAAAR